MKKVLILALALNCGFGYSLKSMLKSANAQNDLVKSKNLQILGAKKSINAVKKSYSPTIDIGAFAQNLSPKTPMKAGAVYGAYVKLNYTIYDGGAKKNTIKQKRYELLSKILESSSFKNTLSLAIVQDYFSIKSLDGLLVAIKYKKSSLNATLEKMKGYLQAGLIEKSVVQRLKAELEMTNYNISSLKLQRSTLLSNLSLKVGKEIKYIGNSHFLKKRVKFSINSEAKAILAKSAAVDSSASVIKSANNPKVNLNFEYNRYGYDRDDATHPKGVDSQAKFTLNANMRLFDGGVNKEKAQIAKLQAASIALEAKHKIKEQKSNFKIAKLRISTIKNKIKSAKASLKAAKKFYADTEKKYRAGFIDNSLYLDALSQKTEALANYKRALNDLEVAYGLYYYFGGKDLKGYVK